MPRAELHIPPVYPAAPRQQAGVAGGLRFARATLRGLFAFLLVLLAFPNMAQAAPKDTTPEGMSRLQLEVFINEQPTKLIGEIFRGGDGRMMLRREEMQALGLAAPGKGEPKELLALDALPGLSTRYNEAEQKLHLSVPDSLRLAQEYDVRETGALPKATPAAESRDYGAVINYNAYGTAARGYTSTSKTYTTGTLSLDSRAFSPLGVLQNTAIVGTSLARQGVLRLESSYVFAHRDSATTTTIGDAISGGLNWSRPVRYGGMQISRSFALRPDLVTAPLPSVSGSAAVPSTVDVFVDNMRIASQDVGAGPFRLSNLPVPGESGTARVVVRDITGKETATALPFFTSSKLLRPGAFDFSLDAGYPRRNYALESFDYSRTFMGQASARYGFNDRLTLEAHAEGTARLALAGLGGTFNAGRLGLFSLAGAGSRYKSEWGGLVHASWQLNLRGVFLGASTQRTLGDYNDVAAVTAVPGKSKLTGNFLDSGFFILDRSAKVPRAMDRLTVGVPVEKYNASLSASLINLEYGRGDTSRLATVTWSQTFAKKYNTFITAFSDFGTTRQTGITAGLSFTLGDDILISTGAGGSRADKAASFEVNKPMGDKPYDYGWRLHDIENAANGSRSSSRGAQVVARTPYARAGAGVRQEGTTVGGYGELDGAVIASPSGVFATPRVNDAFAIVDVGAPGVEVLHENRPVGRSGRSGKVVIPDVQSLQRSKIAIAPETLPGDSHASITEGEIMPSFRGSATLNIKTIAAKDTARVELRDGKGQHFPPGAKLVHEESGNTFTIGYGGLTFLPEIDDVNTLHIQQDNAGCTVRFKRTDRTGVKGFVGPLTCAMQ